MIIKKILLAGFACLFMVAALSGNAAPLPAAARPARPAQAAAANPATEFVALSDKTEDLVSGAPQFIGVQDNLAYAISRFSLLTVDISSPNYPVVTGRFSTVELQYLISGVVYQGRYAYLLTNYYLNVVDLTGHDQPVILSSQASSGWKTLYLHDNQLAAGGDTNLQIFSLANPAAPAPLGNISFSASDYKGFTSTFEGPRYFRANNTRLDVFDFSQPAAISQTQIPHNVANYVYGIVARMPYIFLIGEKTEYVPWLISFDLSEPANPQTLFSGESGTYASNLAAFGNYGIDCENYFDLRDPAHPAFLGSINLPCMKPGGVWSGSRYYSGSSILDGSDPAAPRLLGQLTGEGDYRDGVASGSMVYLAGLNDLAIYQVYGNTTTRLGSLETGYDGSRVGTMLIAYPYLFLLGYNVTVVDISNPQDPAVVATTANIFSYARFGLFTQTVTGKNLIYVAEDDGLTVVDVTNLAAIVKLTKVGIASGSASSLALANGHLFAAYGSAGILTFDLANPLSPQLTGSYTAAPVYGIAVAKGRLYAGTQSALLVFDPAVLPLSPLNSQPMNAYFVTAADKGLLVSNGNMMYLVNITNPDAPRLAATKWFPGGTNAFPSGDSAFLIYAGVWRVRFLEGDSAPFNTGGTLTGGSGRFTYTFGPFNQDVLASTYAMWPAPAAPAGFAPVTPAYGLTVVNNQSANVYVTAGLQVHYNESELSLLDESSLAVFALTNSGWSKLTGSLNPVSNQITVTLPLFTRGWGVFGALKSDLSRLYLPALRNAKSTTQGNPELAAQKIEVIQVTNPGGAGTTPLVAGKPTAVRVYIASGTNGPVSGVRVALYGSINGVPLPGSPLLVGPQTVFPKPLRAIMRSTYNLSLPQAWTSGSPLQLTAVVDPDGNFTESNKANNTASTMVTFNWINTVQVKLVPIAYTHTPTGDYYPAPANQDVSFEFKQMFPIANVTVSYRAPVAWAGNLSDGNGWSNLLSFINSVKGDDGASSSTFYFGAIPHHTPSGVAFPSAYGGMGYLGARTAIGMAFSPGLFAHELGHNVNLDHAPCGGAGNPDPNYPYPNAIIGQFGVNALTLTGYPANRFDFMSYCGPTWISDYNYEKIYDRLRITNADEGPSPRQDAWLVRARLDADGALEMLPAYRMSLSLGDEALSSYQAAIVDASGAVLLEQAMSMTALPDEGQTGAGPSYELRALIPASRLPAAPDLRLVVRRNGETLAERAFQPAAGRTAQAKPGLEGQSLAWAGAAGLYSVYLRPAGGAGNQPWQLYTQDWPSELPLNLPAGSWEVRWVAADSAETGSALAP